MTDECGRSNPHRIDTEAREAFKLHSDTDERRELLDDNGDWCWR